MAKIRLDMLLYDQGLISSREKARAIIIAGEVRVNGTQIDKPGTRVDENSELLIESRRTKYVSRGGLKLEAAIKDFQIDFRGKVVLDVGASTGGYTDCALQNGASRVLALDVGYGQLDWSLRNDPRVTVVERTNIRYYNPEKMGDLVDVVTMDVSFISTTLIYPVLKRLLKEDGEIISLIKPQFEAGKDKVGKKGVVRDPVVHSEVLKRCINAAEQAGFFCAGISYSPIKGPQGNIEYFLYLRKEPQAGENGFENVEKVVREAHSVLEGKKK